LSAVVAAALLSVTGPALKAEAAALPGSIIDGGYIISDGEFYNEGAMSQAQIQKFLDGKVTSCKKGYTCLKDYTGDIEKRAKDQYCAAVKAEKSVPAARIIYVAAKACGINPKVLIVMLQKEQGLVTMNNPGSTRYARALGFDCPDTPQGCDPKYAGFSTQVYLGARQMQIYTKWPSSFSYRAGQYNTIKWAPSSSCGTSKVYIKNQATANLYNYTPYRPNIAALAAGWGTGDSCSTYGNRNFYNYYVAWFDAGASTSSGAPAQVKACTNPDEKDVSTRSGSATVKVAELNARTAPTTLCGSGLKTLKKGTKVTITGQYGAWDHITVDGNKLWVVSSYLKSTSSSSGGGSAASTGCATPAKVTSASGTAVVTVRQLNARQAPTTSCSVGVRTLTQGQKYTRTGTYGVWWRLKVGSATMWAHSDYLALEKPSSSGSSGSSDSSSKPQTAKTTAALNLRSSASLSAKVVTVIPKGKTVTVTKTSGKWSSVKYGSKTGWVANAYLTGFKTSAPTSSGSSSSGTTSSAKSSKATVKTALNLRSSGSLKAKILTVLPRGATVTVTQTKGDWSKVTYKSRTGWVDNDYLSTAKSSSSSTVKKKTTAALNLRSSGSLKAKVLTVIPRGKTVTVKKTSGSWSHVTYGSRTGWVANRYLR